MRREPIKNLFRSATDAKPRHYTWRGETCGERWEYWEADECQECGAVLVVRGEDKHCNVDPESPCEGYLCSEGPMMNTFWPLPAVEDAEEMAEALVGLPVCLVNIGVGPEDEDEWGLALTGGGMDLSWELAEAYMRCGYLPPLHMCSLPTFAGKRLDTLARWVLAGCKASCRQAGSEARQTLASLRDTRKKLAGN